MVAYVVHFKKATAFDEIGVLKYDGKTDAEAATFDLDESRSAYVLQSDNDIIKTLNLNSGPMLVKLYNALGGLIGGEQKAIGRFEDLGAARQRVIMRLLDYGKRLEVQSQPKSEELRLAKEREAAKQKATEDYLSATDEPQRKAAMARLKELDVSVPSQTQVEDHNMVAKRKTAKKGGRKPAAKKEKGKEPVAAGGRQVRRLHPVAHHARQGHRGHLEAGQAAFQGFHGEGQRCELEPRLPQGSRQEGSGRPQGGRVTGAGVKKNTRQGAAQPERPFSL